MGGKAFGDLGDSAFPRISPQVYARIKNRFTEQLKTLYRFVGVPAEAPEKVNHGDVDFVVCKSIDLESDSCTLVRIKETLGAQHAILAEGNRTSSFAVPACNELGQGCDGIFFQVDVHVCSDEAEWERTMFFHSYGDLGMILGLLARTQGFTLGTKGLRTHFAQPDEAHISSFVLSESFQDILPFLDLSMAEWERGFPTLESIFCWVKSSRFFEPRRLADAEPTKAKKAARQQRQMYSAFLDFSHALAIADSQSFSDHDCTGLSFNSDAPREPAGGGSTSSPDGTTDDRGSSKVTTTGFKRAPRLEEALVYFGKKVAYDKLVAENLRRRMLREKLNGTKVMAWTNLHGIAVKWVMDGVREKLSDDDIIKLQEDNIRDLALEVQKKLTLLSNKSPSLDDATLDIPHLGAN